MPGLKISILEVSILNVEFITFRKFREIKMTTKLDLAKNGKLLNRSIVYSSEVLVPKKYVS